MNLRNHQSGHFSRRDFVSQTALAGFAVIKRDPSPEQSSPPKQSCRMRLALSPGAIGVKAAPREAIVLAHKYGFQAIEPNPSFLADLSIREREDLVAEMKSLGLRFSTAGLPVDFRGDQEKFRAGIQALPRLAAALQSAGVERVGTWIAPGHRELTFRQNFRQHRIRLGEVALILRDHQQQLGLEYVGTPSARQNLRFPFLHTMRETQELIAEIGTGNVGYLLDSWHWWTAGDTEEEITALRPVEVVSVDLNDAPAGIALELQQDGRRELPGATGVIPIGAFLQALNRIGYQGPVRAEPFNQALTAMEDSEACSAAISALHRVMSLVDCG